MTTGLMITPVATLTFANALPNTDSMKASPAIRACYRNNGSCPLTSTITITDDSSGVLDTAFMTVSQNTLTVQPTISS